jgi:type I restriction enzyme, S subunit
MRTEKFKNLFWFGPKSNIKAGDGLGKGRFPFYSSSPKQTKWIDKQQHFDEALIFGTGGLASVHFENQPFSTSTDCIVAISNNKEIKTKFVYYYLFGNIHLLERGFKGAGLKHISKKYIENLDIPVFPFETQNKIVAILDKASTLVNKREGIIKHLDNLLNATFLKQFGHLINNPLAGVVEELQSNITVGDKINYGVVQPGDDFVGGIPIVRVGDFEDSYINPSTLKTIDPEIHKKHKNSILNGGEVLIACVGATIGKVALVEDSFKGFNIVRATARINCGNKIKNTYLLNLLLSDYYQHQLKILSRTVAQPTLNIKQIEELKIPIPPMEEQIRFDKFYHTLIANKKKSKASLRILEELFLSLSQKIYNGQLNFNVDFELDSLIQKNDLQKKKNEEYSATDNDKTEQKPIINIKIKNKTDADIKNIPFNETEGNAIFNQVFSKKTKGFGFDEFETFLKTEGFTYEYQQLKDFIFNKLENKELIQFYSNEEWRKKNYKKNTNPLQDDFAGDGKIYLVPNKTKK